MSVPVPSKDLDFFLYSASLAKIVHFVDIG
jgi:hypothetical protein